jgi:hypothetical protein
VNTITGIEFACDDDNIKAAAIKHEFRNSGTWSY